MKFLKIFKTKTKTKTPNINELMDGWTDKECLQNFCAFMPRVGVSAEHVQDEYGFITHQVLNIRCGDNLVSSPPLELDWPLEPVVFPEEYKSKRH